MLDQFKKIINRDTKVETKKLKPNNDTIGLNKSTLMSQNTTQTMQNSQNYNMNKNGSVGSLSAPKVSNQVKDVLTLQNKDKQVAATVSTSSSLIESVATMFAEGETEASVDMLRNYINENQGRVEKRYWFMLLDIYQILDDFDKFEKVANSFTEVFGISPPTWVENENNKKNSMTGKNILLLEPKLDIEFSLKFKDFLKSSKEESFCRINVSQCKFEQSDFLAFQALLQLFSNLRKNRVKSVLMGDNNLVNFCKKYINPNPMDKQLNEIFLTNEGTFWLFYLELLQWKGEQNEFEDLAFEYAMKFEISPPDWDEQGMMTFEKDTSSVEETRLDKVITYNNIDSLFNLIKSDLETSNNSEIDLLHVERIDFGSIGSITHFVQEFVSDSTNSNKQIILKNPNEMLLILFELLGINEWVTVIPRTR